MLALAISITMASWAAADITPPLSAGILAAGLGIYWALLPKAVIAPRPPLWAILPLGAAFVAGIFVAAWMASVDRDLLGAGYWLWFTLWLQLGLFVTERFGVRSGIDS